MAKKTIKTAIIGSGMMGVQHALALRRIPGVEVVAICDPVSKNLAEKAESLGIPYAYSDIEKMLEEQQPDVIHNCTPNSEHYKISKLALERGIAVYSEKPLGVSVEEAQSLVALAEKNHTANGVNFNYRSNAMVREMRARLRRGTPGKVLLVHGQYVQDWLMYDTDFNWRVDSRIGGKSRTVADVGSHWFDTIQLILDARIEAVYAKLLTVYKQRKRPLVATQTFSNASGGAYELVDVDTEDAGFIMVRFADGTYGNIVLSQVSGGYKNSFTVSVDCANYSMQWDQESPDKLQIGDRNVGSIKVLSAAGGNTDDANAYTTLPAGHAVGWADALSNNINLFYTAIKNGTANEEKQEYATFRDAAYIMKIVDACLRSNEEDKWIEVKE